FGVQESAVPQRLAGVGAVAPHHDLRDAIVGVPPHRVALLPSVEPEGRILVMQRVIVAAREEGAHDEPHARCRSRELPRQDHPRRSPRARQLRATRRRDPRDAPRVVLGEGAAGAAAARACARSSMLRVTSAVHPVWWLAPTPRPESPWKYSLKSTRSRQWGSVAYRGSSP